MKFVVHFEIMRKKIQLKPKHMLTDISYIEGFENYFRPKNFIRPSEAV